MTDEQLRAALVAFEGIDRPLLNMDRAFFEAWKPRFLRALASQATPKAEPPADLKAGGDCK